MSVLAGVTEPTSSGEQQIHLVSHNPVRSACGKGLISTYEIDAEYVACKSCKRTRLWIEITGGLS